MKKNFDQDFKLEAMNLVLRNKRSFAAVAGELGIHANTLYCQWHNKNTHPEMRTFS